MEIFSIILAYLGAELKIHYLKRSLIGKFHFPSRSIREKNCGTPGKFDFNCKVQEAKRLLSDGASVTRAKVTETFI